MHEEIDNAILAAIKGGAVRFTPICIAVEKRLARYCAWRDIDRRLQALRRRKLIEFAGTPKRWREC